MRLLKIGGLALLGLWFIISFYAAGKITMNETLFVGLVLALTTLYATVFYSDVRYQ